MPASLDSLAAIAELNALRAAMSSAKAEAKSESEALDALKRAAEARAHRRSGLETALSAARGRAKVSGLGDLSIQLRTHRRAPRSRASLGDLAGTGGAAWTRGQYQKIEFWANQGAWSSMLEAASRIAFPGKVEPEDALKSPERRAALERVVSEATALVPQLQRDSVQAIREMAASVSGEPSRVAFDREEYDAAAQGDLSYIQTHKKQGELVHALKGAGRVVASLDKYVPGWGVLLDVATPVLPVAPLITSLLSAIPVAGTAVRIATTAVPGFGASGLIPGTSLAQTSFSLGRAVQSPLESALQTVVGPVGAVKFQLTKSTAKAASQGLGVLDTLEKIGTDLLDGYAFAATLAGFFVVGPELLALQAAISALQAGVTLAKVAESSRALKKAAARSRAEAQAKSARDLSELEALERELVALQTKLTPRPRATKTPSATTGLGKIAAALALAWLASEVLS